MDNAVRGATHLSDAPSVTLTAADLAAIDGLRKLHESRSAATVTTTPHPATPDIDVALDAPTCPIPGMLRGSGAACPIPGVGGTPGEPVQRSKADLFVRRLLRIRDTGPVDLSDKNTYRAFRRSMTISAIRCTLTYVVFPILLPSLSFMKGVGPIVGILIGTFALVCDTFTIRRFFAVDHKYRWQFSAVAFGIMCLLSILLVQDISHVVGNLLR